MATAIVWGLIIYRVISSLNKEPEIESLPNLNSTKKSIDTSGHMAYNLLLNYPDPFGTTDDSSNVLQGINESRSEFNSSISGQLNNAIPKVRIDFIQYKGLITNPRNHKVVAVISINGKDEMVKNGQILENIRICKITKGEILISYLGGNYRVKKL